MIKLIVCDLDMTILPKPLSTVPEELFPLIRLMKERGIEFAAATGRQAQNVRTLFRETGGGIYIISDNGGTMFYWDELIRTAEMNEGREEEIIDDILNTPDVYLEMTGITTGYMIKESGPLWDFLKGINEDTMIEDPHVRPEPVTKISFNELGHREVDPEKVRFFQEKYGDSYSVVQSGNGWVDIYSAKCGKGPALKDLIQRLGLKKEEVVVFGDNENDVSMFEEAGLSYAREFSLPDVKAKADRVTTDPVKEIGRLLEEMR
jgi:Cof subfamily protein (haloacid dehalogenase superfamily)